MAKEEKNYSNEFKKINILLYIIMTLIILLGIIFLINNKAKNKEKNIYDVSMMHEIGVDEALKLFNDDDTFVLYIGRETCDICQDLLPKLQTAQIENNYITQYIDLTKVDRKGENWQNLVKLLNVSTTQTLTSNGSGEKVTETFGYFLNEKGFTPCVIVISKGKMVAGFFGDKELISLEDWLHNNGI